MGLSVLPPPFFAESLLSRGLVDEEACLLGVRRNTSSLDEELAVSDFTVAAALEAGVDDLAVEIENYINRNSDVFPKVDS